MYRNLILDSYNKIKTVDPNHVVFMNFAFAHGSAFSGGSRSWNSDGELVVGGTNIVDEYVRDLALYSKAADIISVDIYPVATYGRTTPTSWPDRYSLFNDVDLSLIGKYQKLLNERVVRNSKPVYQVLQSWSEVGTSLTSTEVRFQAYDAIINGAAGLLWFGWHVPAARTTRGDPTWERTKVLVRDELSNPTLYPVLSADTSPRHSSVSVSTDDIEFLLKEYNGQQYLFAANTSPSTTHSVTFSGLSSQATSAEVMFESRTVNCTAGQIQDSFGPYQVHVYKLDNWSGSLAQDVTWSGRIRVTGDVTIPASTTLTIARGTEVRFLANTDDIGGGNDIARSELIVEGDLTVEAKSEVNDGGVTFRSANTVDPSNADWYGIRVREGGTVTLSDATVQDGSRCVQNEGGTLTVDANTTLSNCGATVTLNPTPPYVDREIAAKLENSDMSMTDPKWQWQRWRSTDAWTNIASATLATYTPTTKDIGSQIRATVRYQAKTNVYPHAQSAATVPVAGVPGAPQNLVAEETNEAVQLTWETPTSDGGTPITGYAYRYSADDGTTWQPSETGGQLDETIFYIDHTIGNLINGTEYTFEVWAVNKVGNGASASVKATPQALALMAVSFGSSSYQAFEGGDAVQVVVQLSPSPSQLVRIPVVVSADPGTETDDYTVAGLRQGKVWLSFAAGVSLQSFALTANEDADSDDETVSLSFETFGTWSASDGTVGATGQARVTLRDNDTDTQPVFPPSGTAQEALTGHYFSFTRPSASGGNAPLSYSVKGSCAGLTVTSSSVSGQPSKAGQCGITRTVRDSDGDSDTYALQISVATDTVPSFASSGTSKSAITGQYFSFTRPAASDGNLPLTYSFSGSCPGLTGTASSISGQPSKAGQCRITWTVRDSDGDTDTYSLQISVAADTAPSFASSGTSRSALVGQYFSFTRPAASDGNGALRYSVSGSCAGLTVTSSSVSGSPSKADQCGITWTVRDSDGDSDTYALQISVAADTAPSFASSGTSRSALVGQYFSFTRPAASGGNGALRYSVSGSCTGLTVTASSASGAPSSSGQCGITWTVRDTDGDTDTYALQIAVAADTAPSFASSGTSRSAITGQYFSFTRPAASGGNGTLRYSVSGSCPGLTVTTSSVSGSPSKAGQCGITRTVRDTDGDSDTYAPQIAVAADTAPAFASSGTSRSALVGQYFSFTRPAASGGNGALRYSVSGTCAGLTVTASSASGAPSKAGSCRITWTVRDSDGDTDTYSLQLSVRHRRT